MCVIFISFLRRINISPIDFEIFEMPMITIGGDPNATGPRPGTYQLCWCPQTADCSSTALFRAPGGTLQANCPAGSFATGPISGWVISLSCPKIHRFLI